MFLLAVHTQHHLQDLRRIAVEGPRFGDLVLEHAELVNDTGALLHISKWQVTAMMMFFAWRSMLCWSTTQIQGVNSISGRDLNKIAIALPVRSTVLTTNVW
jgi:hypothetical protein